jgi:hypothetical protein
VGCVVWWLVFLERGFCFYGSSLGVFALTEEDKSEVKVLHFSSRTFSELLSPSIVELAGKTPHSCT